MAFSRLQQFYRYHQQEPVMNYLNRRGMTPEDLATLQWQDFDGSWRVRKGECEVVIEDREIRLHLYRLRQDSQRLQFPLRFVFYAEPPEKSGAGGRGFTAGEIYRLCGCPTSTVTTIREGLTNLWRKLLTKAKSFDRIRVSKAFIKA